MIVKLNILKQGHLATLRYSSKPSAYSGGKLPLPYCDTNYIRGGLLPSTTKPRMRYVLVGKTNHPRPRLSTGKAHLICL